jgi:hypothetical protein
VEAVVRLGEGLEDVAQHVGGDADPIVGDMDHDAAAAEPDLAARDACDVEEVVDEPRELVRLALDDGLRAARLVTAHRSAIEDVDGVVNGLAGSAARGRWAPCGKSDIAASTAACSARPRAATSKRSVAGRPPVSSLQRG